MNKFEDFVATGEFIEREMTDDEVKQSKKDQAEIKAKKAVLDADEATKAETKSALLDRLGLTAEEAQILLS